MKRIRAYDPARKCRFYEFSGWDLVDSDNHEYPRGAMLPRTPLSRSLRALESADAETSVGEFVSVIEIEPDALEMLKELEREGGPASLPEAARHLLDAMSPWFDCDNSIALGGFRRAKTRMGTTTIDPESMRRIGVHVDAWESVTPGERVRCRNRICVNLGARHRYFVFFPVTLDELWRCHTVVCEAAVERVYGLSRMARAAITETKGTPLLALEIAPGEAYVAPTENLAHDAWLSADDEDDVTFTMRGHFWPRVDPIA